MPKPPEPTIPASSNAIIAEMNRVRARNGRRPLTENECLTKRAKQHAQDMAQNNRLTHDGAGERIRSCQFLFGSENITWGQRTPRAAVSAWQASSDHRHNQLGEWDACGAAEHERYWCVIFASNS